MAKLTLNDLGNLQNELSATTTINGNNAAIEVALENTLSRNGAGPNTMGAPLDMNSNRIINLPEPQSQTDPVRLGDLSGLQNEVTSVAGKKGDVLLTKADVGLSSVDNTSDISKPISNSTQAALNALQAQIGSGGGSGAVTSVAGKTGAVTLDKTDVGLANVNNTSDASKPVSSATQTALDLKAPIADPTFTGVPRAPTAALGTNTTQIASTAFVLANIPASNLNLNSVALNDYYSLTSSGSNWSPALNAAFADMDSTGKYLTIHNSDFNCNSAVVRSSSLRFIIEGSSRSSLNFTGSGDGIALTFASANQGPHLENLFIRTSYSGIAGTALKLIGPYQTTQPYMGAKLYGVRIAPVDPTQSTWTTGFYLEEVWNPILRDVEFKGKGENTSALSAQNGIQVHNCQTVHIQNYLATHVKNGVKESGDHWCEGFDLKNAEMVGVGTGIQLAVAFARLNGSIADSHINAFDYCVDGANIWSMSVHDNLFFKTNFATAPWIGVRSVNGRHWKIHNNHFRPSGATADANAIRLNNTNYCKVHFNTFDDWGSQPGTGISLAGSADYNELAFNSRNGTSPPPALYINTGSGANNRYYGNSPDQNNATYAQFAAQ